MSLAETHWPVLSEVLDKALDAPRRQRQAIIRASFPDDPELCAEALALLQAATEAPSLLDHDAWQCAGTWVEEGGEDAVIPDSGLAEGTQVGAYTIDAPIGVGGSSYVYEAHRSDGLFEQVVAIKVLRGGQRANFGQRFLRERSILAALTHPYIARVFDGGTTPDGDPFFVMERVEGTPITEYCNTHQLTIKERLELLCDVIEAVQYAHQHLIVHRDLKPSNILVTETGQVRLLDFGIAKVLEESGLAATLDPYETQVGTYPMTPGYAAPEQIEEGPISTRTDVYALGRICYELVSGCSPIEADTTAPYALMQAVCEGNLRTMYQRFHGLSKEEQAAIAGERSTSVVALRHVLQSDLCAVLGQALARDPEQRYGAAAELRRDLEHYLSDRPVQARTSTPLYRARTYMRRNRWAITGAMAALLVVIGYAFTVTLYSQQMKAERDKSEAVTTFLTDLFAASDPVRNATGSPDLTVREVLDRGAMRLDENMREAPQVRADLQGTLAQVYNSLGLYSQAEPLLREALATQAEGGDAIAQAHTKRELGYMFFRTGNYEEAERYLTDALASFERVHGATHPGAAPYLNTLALVYNSMGNGVQSETLLRRAIQLQGEDKQSNNVYLHNLAIALQQQGRFEEAFPLHEAAINMRRAQYAADHPNLASALARYAYSLHLNGNMEQAATVHQEALDMRRNVLPDVHPHIASSLIRYGWLEAERGNGQQAEAMVREGIEMLTQFVPDSHWEVQAGWGIVGVALIQQGQVDEGRTYLVPVYRQFEAAFGPDDWRTQRVRGVLLQTGGVPDSAAG